jgi:hypothetical protein
MTDRLDEIRRLVDALPGTPWSHHHRGANGLHAVIDVEGSPVTAELIEEEAVFIAAAPELLAWAAGEIERLREDQRSALSNAWCAGVNDALADVPGGDEYASAINAHANALTNPYEVTP